MSFNESLRAPFHKMLLLGSVQVERLHLSAPRYGGAILLRS